MVDSHFEFYQMGDGIATEKIADDYTLSSAQWGGEIKCARDNNNQATFSITDRLVTHTTTCKTIYKISSPYRFEFWEGSTLKDSGDRNFGDSLIFMPRGGYTYKLFLRVEKGHCALHFHKTAHMTITSGPTNVQTSVNPAYGFVFTWQHDNASPTNFKIEFGTPYPETSGSERHTIEGTIPNNVYLSKLRMTADNVYDKTMDTSWESVESGAYQLFDRSWDLSNVFFEFIEEIGPGPGPGPTPPGPILTTYPIVFYNNEMDVVYMDLGNTQEYFAWDKYYINPLTPGVYFRPSLNAWQMYQSSYIVPAGEGGSRQLKKIINNYFQADSAPVSADKMRMVIECGELGNLDLGEIQSIRDTYTSDLAAIPVVPYGYSRGFCMDLGVKRQIVVNYKRVMPECPCQPDRPDDPGYSTDSRTWTNAKWIERLKKIMDRWQMRTNGVRLYQLVPGDRLDCYPPINPNIDATNPDPNHVNAFIINAPIQYSSKSMHEIESSITFQIGTIYPKATPLPTSYVILHGVSGTEPVKTQFPSGSYSALPYCPESLMKGLPEGAWFVGWRDSPDPGSHFIGNPGDPFQVPIEGHVDLYADFIDATRGDLFEFCGYEVVKTLYARRRYDIISVGGGGSGGAYHYLKYPSTQSNGGGGGGSGYMRTDTIVVGDDTDIHIYVGKGGDPPSDEGANGNPGQNSYFYIGGGSRYEAKGGNGGGGASKDRVGTGGDGSKKGGNGGAFNDSPQAQAGEGATEQYGQGGDKDDLRGGGGGGAAPADWKIYKGGVLLTGGGGNGWKFKSGAVETQNGHNSGGGAGGSALDGKKGGSGGNGLIYIIGGLKS